MSEIAEVDMLAPVLTLFPRLGFERYEQVPLGRKRIDLLCISKADQEFSAVELKISNWRRAVWQATINFQLAHFSYIAIWHEFIHRPNADIELLKAYGIGLISVSRKDASIVLPSMLRPKKIPRREKVDWYRNLLKIN